MLDRETMLDRGVALDREAMLDAVVVGAGPAGLAASRELAKRNIDHLVLEKGRAPGHCWSRLYDSLRLHTGKHLSGLPGRPLPSSAPLFVPRSVFLDYLRDYAAHFDLPIRSECAVRGVTPIGGELATGGCRDAGTALPDSGGWKVETEEGRIRARTLVMATGILSNPRIPDVPGQESFPGTIRHSVEYRRPDPFVGRHVLVVGAGNSAGEIAPELARSGADVTVAIRSGTNVVPLTVLGLPVQYLAWVVLRLPKKVREVVVGTFGRAARAMRGEPPFPPAEGSPLDSIPLIGFGLVNAIRSGAVDLKGGIERMGAEGVTFEDGSTEPYDDVILATGYRPALGPLEGLVRTDEEGFALRTDRVSSADHPGLYFIGHNYEATGGLSNIRRDAPIVGNHVRGRVAGGG